MHPEAWYAENNVDLRRGTEVTAIDRAAHEVELADGTRLPYGALILATGAEPRSLPIPGADTALTLRTHADSDRIRATFGEGKRLVVIGAGWIGLEVAAAAREAGTDVVVLEAAELPLLGVLGPEMGEVFAQLHRDHGVDLRLGAKIAEITPSGVRLEDGERARGRRGAARRGRAAPHRARRGGRAGRRQRRPRRQVAAHQRPRHLRRRRHRQPRPPGARPPVRVEHWATALNQPATAAAAILGEDAAYDRLPYFFSDQYDLGMEYIGHATRDDTARVVVRGDVDQREFVAFWLDDQDRILAAMNVNVWDVPDEVKPLIAARTVVDPDKLIDPDTAYADVGR